MSLKIVGPDREGKHLACGTRVWLDGKEIHEIRNIEVRFPVDDVVSVDIECFATDKVEIDTDANINLELVVMPGYRIVKNEHLGRTVIHCEKEAE